MNRLAPTKPYGCPLLPTTPHRTPSSFPPHRTAPVRSVSRTVSVTRWGRVWWVSSEHKEPAERRCWRRRRHGREPAETGSRIPGGGTRMKATRNGRAGIVPSTGTGWQRPAAEFRQRCSIESNPGAAVLSAKIIHRVPSPYKFVVDRSGSCFAGLILSRAGVRPARDKINPAKRLASETPLFAQIRCVPKRCSFLRINFVTGWLKGSP